MPKVTSTRREAGVGEVREENGEERIAEGRDGGCNGTDRKDGP